MPKKKNLIYKKRKIKIVNSQVRVTTKKLTKTTTQCSSYSGQSRSKDATSFRKKQRKKKIDEKRKWASEFRGNPTNGFVLGILD